MNIDAIKITNLKEVATTSAGYPLRGATSSLAAGGVAVLQMRNASFSGKIDWPSAVRVELPTKRSPNWLESGDIVFVARGARNYAIALHDVPDKSVCSPHFFVLKVKAGCDPAFLAWQINQRPAQDYLKRSATGSNVLSIRREALEKLQVAIPPLNQQKTIVKYFQAATAERSAFEKLIENRNYEIEAIALGLFQNSKRGNK